MMPKTWCGINSTKKVASAQPCQVIVFKISIPRGRCFIGENIKLVLMLCAWQIRLMSEYDCEEIERVKVVCK